MHAHVTVSKLSLEEARQFGLTSKGEGEGKAKSVFGSKSDDPPLSDVRADKFLRHLWTGRNTRSSIDNQCLTLGRSTDLDIHVVSSVSFVEGSDFDVAFETITSGFFKNKAG